MPIILLIIITVAVMCILFKMPSLIIYYHNELKSLSRIDFSCVFNVGLRSLIHSASAIFRFRLLFWKFLSIALKSITVLTLLYDFSMLCFKTCDVWSLPLWSWRSFILCYSMSTFSHTIVNVSWFRTFRTIN